MMDMTDCIFILELINTIPADYELSVHERMNGNSEAFHPDENINGRGNSLCLFLWGFYMKIVKLKDTESLLLPFE